MKKTANSKKQRLTWREKYRRVAIQVLKQERGLKIIDIDSIQDAIEVEYGRSPKIDELITAFKRKDCGLRIDISGGIAFVSLVKSQSKGEKREAGKARVAKPKKKAGAAKSKGKARQPAKEKKAASFLIPNLSPEEFTLLAIKELRGRKFKGIHSVYSGFNAAFRDYFPGLDPVKEVDKLVKAGKVERKFARGGASLYLPGEGPGPEELQEGKGQIALKKMGVIK